MTGAAVARIPSSFSDALRFELPIQQWRRQYDEGESIQLCATLTAALSALFYRYSGESTITLDVTFYQAGDAYRALLSLQLGSSQTFAQLVKSVQQNILRQRPELAKRRDIKFRRVDIVVPPEIGNELVQPSCPGASRDITPGFLVSFRHSRSGVAGMLRYRSDCFDKEAMLRFAGHLENLLQSASHNSAAHISQLAVLSQKERRKILGEWNDTERPCPKGSVPELFEQQAAASPDAIALIDGDTKITYRELNEQANRLAHCLQDRGVGPEFPVGFCMEQSWRAVVAILGILKAGGAYVPLDPNYPRQRLSEMLRETKVLLVVSCKRFEDRIPPGPEIVSVDRDSPLISAASPLNPNSGTTPDSMAYVLYTSGSLGTPKAVVGIQRSIINGLAAITYAPDEICCLNAFISFGFAIANLFLPLLCGLPLVIVSEDDLRDINGLVNVLEKERVTRIVLIPTVFKQILDLGPEKVSKLRHIREIGLAGATLTPDLIHRFSVAMPGSRLHNCYSSSEIGTPATLWPVTPEAVVRREALIGRPAANTRIYILDKDMNPVPVGVAGEIYVGAAHLARGYLNRPDLTAERFLRDPFQPEAGARLYRTGDLGRYLPGGDLEYLGRSDDQVKIRGFRIEPAEIEAALCLFPGVAEAVVTPRDAQNLSLAAFIVWKSELRASSAELRAFLAKRLPDFMIPTTFTPIACIPLLPIGKVDRNALPVPSSVDGREGPPVPPSNVEEVWLLELWESVLGTSNLGVCDSFFDLGGSSLQASALMNGIEERLNRRVPATVLLKASTVRLLADYLSRHDGNPPELVPIKLGGQPPLFVINPPASIRLLAPKLASDQSVIGVALPEGEWPGLEPIAAQIARMIREYQPNPPYYLSGWCASGNLAFEIARQMAASGVPVDLVVLFESFNFAQTRLVRYWCKRAVWHFSNLRAKRLSQIPAYFQARSAQALLHAKRLSSFARYRYSSPFEPPNCSTDSSRSNDEALNRVSYAHVPKEYLGQVVLFRSSDRLHGFSHDATLGWGSITPNLKILDVPGDHTTMFFPPHVDNLASKLAELLAGQSKGELPKSAEILGDRKTLP